MNKKIVIVIFIKIVFLIFSIGLLNLFFVQTSIGQHIDNDFMLFMNKKIITPYASGILTKVNVGTIFIVAPAIFFICFWAKRIDLIFAASFIIIGSNATTQILKNFVFTRPNLTQSGYLSNSYPSGHTTLAASSLFALIFVVHLLNCNKVFMKFIKLVSWVLIIAIGLSTISMQWHRPSDVIGGILVPFLWVNLTKLIYELSSSLREKSFKSKSN